MVAEWIRRYLDSAETKHERPDDHEIWRQGKQAEASLNDPALARAFDTLAERYAADWANTKQDEPGARERAYWRLTALRDVRGHMSGEIRAASERNPT